MLKTGKQPHKTLGRRRILTISEVGEIFRVSRPTVYKWLWKFQQKNGKVNFKDGRDVVLFCCYLYTLTNLNGERTD